MTELTYLPTDWMDEYVPDTQADATNFIYRDAKGVYHLRPLEYQEDFESYTKVLKDGEIIMFRENRVFGDFTLTVREDGVWKTAPSTIPPEANCIRIDHDTDTLQPTVALLISENGLLPGDYDIDAYWWSEYDVPFRFVIEGDTARFARIEGQA